MNGRVGSALRSHGRGRLVCQDSQPAWGALRGGAGHKHDHPLTLPLPFELFGQHCILRAALAFQCFNTLVVAIIKLTARWLRGSAISPLRCTLFIAKQFFTGILPLYSILPSFRHTPHYYQPHGPTSRLHLVHSDTPRDLKSQVGCRFGPFIGRYLVTPYSVYNDTTNTTIGTRI